MKPKIYLLVLSLYFTSLTAQTDWHITGNSGTNPLTNFVGTTDDVILKFRVNNQLSGIIDDTLYNTGLGYQMLQNNSTGYNTVAIGYQALNRQTTGNTNTAVGIRALYSNTTGSNNTAYGFNSLYLTTTAINNTGIGQNTLYHTTSNSNTAVGSNVLYTNTTGFRNTGLGENVLFLNTTGNYNTGLGSNALYSNTTGNNNIAIGHQALYLNTIGRNNTAAGVNALSSNQNGSDNIAIGISTLLKNIYGFDNVAVGDSALFNATNFYNTAMGSQALSSNTTGYGSTAVGTFALNSSKTGYVNSALGYNTDVSDSALYNATAIGYSAVATASNQVMLGNTSVTSVKAAGSFVIYSDGRYKKDIKSNVPGLVFINQLRPVTYHYDIHGMNDKMTTALQKKQAGNLNPKGSLLESAIDVKEKKLYTGFVAQDVEAAAKNIDYDFSGVYTPQNDKDLYGLSYADFVVPLVKSVQELSKLNNEKDSVITTLQSEVDHIKIELENLKAMIQSSDVSHTSTSISSASISQNIPNPFNNTTTIDYRLPNQFSNAQIIIFDQGGKALKKITLSKKGAGTISVDALMLTSGTYNYSLVVDNKLFETKQMVLIR